MPLAEEHVALLEEGIREDPALQDFNDLNGLAKSYIETKKMVGGMVKVPGEDATEEDLGKWYGRLRPESADHYEIAKPEDSAIPWDENLEKGFRGKAHELGLDKRQAKGMADWYMEFSKQAFGDNIKTTEEGVNILKGEWGGDFDKNMELVDRAYKALGNEELSAFLEASGLGNHPAIAKLMARVGSILEEDEAGGAPPNEDEILTAREQITALKNDGCMSKARGERCPYHKGEDQGEQDRVRKLYEIAYPRGREDVA